MEYLLTPEALISLLTLTVMEIVLGIDNIVFISILTGKLPLEQQKKGRRLGLAMALITRILLLLSISWVMNLTKPLFDVSGLFNITDPTWLPKFEFTGKDLVLILGGLFLIYKSTKEIHHKVQGETEEELAMNKKKVSFSSVIIQIMILDIVFSLDSVITAVGMAKHIEIMIIAVIIAVIIMMLASESISRFVSTHPTVKMLALSFLLLIGVTLIADGFDQHIPKGYIYFAMGFSILVESLNLKSQKKKTIE